MGEAIHNNPKSTGLPLLALGIVFLSALAIRLINLAFIGDPAAHGLLEDSPIYWNGAQSWIDSGYFSYIAEHGFKPETERMPLYNLFLIPFRWAFGENVLSALIGQAFLDAGTCVIIAKLGGLLGRQIGLVSGLFAAVSPNLIIHSALILSDTLFAFLFALILLYSAKYLRDQGLRNAAYAGLICGLAISTRLIALLIPVAMAFAAPFICYRVRQAWGPGLLAGALIIVMALLPVSPILQRNITSFDTIQLTSQKGRHFLSWSVGYSQSLHDGSTFECGSARLNNKMKAWMTSNEVDPQKLNPFEASNIAFLIAKQELQHIAPIVLIKGWISGAILNLAAPAIISDPRVRRLNSGSFMGSSGSGIFERAWNFLISNDVRYLAWVGLGGLGGALFLGLQLTGAVILFRRHFWPAFFASLAVLYFLLASGPIGGPKYRLPYEAILILFQSIAFVWILERLRVGRQPRNDIQQT